MLGRLVRLGSVADALIAPHALPDLASEALGQALALVALFGSALPGDGKVILQTRTDGAVSLMVADFDASPADGGGRLRGYARFDAGALAGLTEPGLRLDAGAVLGSGHLAITIDQGLASDRYQGVVALEGVSLAGGAANYFEQREALPTFVRLAVARHYASGLSGAEPGWRWRAGGFMLQQVDKERDEDWSRVRLLASTLEDHELLDPALTPERLLLRLFHEEGVAVERVTPLADYCRCSRTRILDVLSSFGAKELSGMRDEAGAISVTCEFCTKTYAFALSDIGEP